MFDGRNATCSVSAEKLVEGERADQPDGHIFFGNELGRIQHIVGLRLGESLVEYLDPKIPLREAAGADRLE